MGMSIKEFSLLSLPGFFIRSFSTALQLGVGERWHGSILLVEKVSYLKSAKLKPGFEVFTLLQKLKIRSIPHDMKDSLDSLEGGF